MNARSRTLPRLTLPGSPNVISLPASQGGPSLSPSPGSPTITLSGPAVVPANLSPRQAKARGLMMSGICGLRSTGSSNSVALQELLANRLQQKLPTLGSTLYALTWKPWVLPSGLSLSRLRASVLRTSATERTGWATPTTRDWKDGASMAADVPMNSLLGRMVWLTGWPTTTVTDSLRRPSSDFQTPNITLNHAALLSGWNTPRASDGSNGGPNQAGGALTPDAHLAAWPTPQASDDKWRYSSATQAERRLSSGKQMSLEAWAHLTGPARLTVTGLLLTGSPAAMGSGGQFNPAHSRWLMGFPPAWDACAPTATRSTRGKRRSS